MSKIPHRGSATLGKVPSSLLDENGAPYMPTGDTSIGVSAHGVAVAFWPANVATKPGEIPSPKGSHADRWFTPSVARAFAALLEAAAKESEKLEREAASS